MTGVAMLVAPAAAKPAIFSKSRRLMKFDPDADFDRLEKATDSSLAELPHRARTKTPLFRPLRRIGRHARFVGPRLPGWAIVVRSEWNVGRVLSSAAVRKPLTTAQASLAASNWIALSPDIARWGRLAA
jgi:hypothetical protein